MVTWQQIGQGEPNPFDVTYTTNSPYSASYGEFVITEGSQVDLPSPTPNGAVAVRSFKQTVTITTPSGAIRDIGSKVHLESPEYVLLVSDGTNWYVQSNESGIGRVIPDSAVRQWPFAERTNTTIVENLANDNGSVLGEPINVEDTGFFAGHFENCDSSDDSTSANDGINLPVSEWNNQIQSKNWGFAFTTETNATIDSQHQNFGCVDGTGFIIAYNNLRLRDANVNEVQVEQSTGLGDGTRSRVFWIVDTDDGNNWRVFINDTEDSTTITTNSSSFDASTISLSNGVAFGGRIKNNVINRPVDGFYDNPILYDSPTRQDVTEDYNLQPWS